MPSDAMFYNDVIVLFLARIDARRPQADIKLRASPTSYNRPRRFVTRAELRLRPADERMGPWDCTSISHAVLCCARLRYAARSAVRTTRVTDVDNDYDSQYCLLSSRIVQRTYEITNRTSS